MASSGNEQGANLIITSGGRQSPEQTLLNSTLQVDGDVTEQQYRDALYAERSESSGGLSIHVHLPFCPSRCLSCDHQTSVVHDPRQIDRYIDALEREVQLITAHLGQGQPLQQLHLGGGTPNYLSEVQLVRLIDILDRHFTFSEETEASLDANAHRASYSQLMLLHGLGFRTLNLEVRDLDPDVQEALGRHQSTSVVRDVVESARSIGFSTVSTDLVYGLPRQSVSSIKKTVKLLLELNPDRVHCYTYKRRTAHFQHQRAINKRELPSLGDKVAMFSHVVDGFSDAGFDWIGLDCFALKSDRIAAAHRNGTLRRNQIGYTSLQGRSVLGLGSSAVSDLSSICLRNDSNIQQWQSLLESGTLPVGAGQILGEGDRARRNALSDLMCNLRLDDEEQTLRFDDQEDVTLNALRDDGMIEINGTEICITEPGRYALHQLWGDSSPSYRWGATA